MATCPWLFIHVFSCSLIRASAETDSNRLSANQILADTCLVTEAAGESISCGTKKQALVSNNIRERDGERRLQRESERERRSMREGENNPWT